MEDKNRCYDYLHKKRLQLEDELKVIKDLITLVE